MGQLTAFRVDLQERLLEAAKSKGLVQIFYNCPVNFYMYKFGWSFTYKNCCVLVYGHSYQTMVQVAADFLGDGLFYAHPKSTTPEEAIDLAIEMVDRSIKYCLQ